SCDCGVPCATRGRLVAVTVIQLLEQLRALDVRVWVDGDRLRYDAPRGAMSAPLRDRLRDHQDELLRLLRAAAEVEHASCYIPVRDGVRLAADVFRPRRGGAVVEQPLPVLWCQERYHRSERVDGVLLTKLDSHPWLRDVVRAGYVVAVVDGRGTGASTGVRTSEFSDEEVADTYDVTEWFADQPWCDGAVGMFGDSYRGIIQYLAAAAGPPHLRAIFPQMAMFD